MTDFVLFDRVRITEPKMAVGYRRGDTGIVINAMNADIHLFYVKFDHDDTTRLLFASEMETIDEPAT